MGVTKLMSVTDAKEKCPQLVLVKGEDLTHYREMSYKVTGNPVHLAEVTTLKSICFIYYFQLLSIEVLSKHAIS